MPDELQAEMVRSVLESNGIASIVRRPALGEIQWGAINVGMGGAREVIVAASDLEQARALLDDPQPDAGERDPDLATMDARAGRARTGWALVVLLLFGVPIAIAMFATLAGIVDGIG